MINPSSINRIVSTVAAWPGVQTGELGRGGKDFLLGCREIGHVHGGELVDIPFPKNLRDELVAAGRAEPHRVLPRSGWVSIPLDSERNIDRAIELLKLSYDLALTN